MVELVDDAKLRKAMLGAERYATVQTLHLLRRELGWWLTTTVLADLVVAQLRGAPFRKLGPPIDRRDRLSRQQLGSAVLLYRALKPRISHDRALKLTHRAIEAGGVRFLGMLLADFEGPQDGVPDDGFLREMFEVAGRFFNAEGELRVEGQGVRFDVARCRFVELLRAIDEEALMPLFCAVDASYFTPAHTQVKLRRHLTLAQGDARCDFYFEQ